MRLTTSYHLNFNIVRGNALNFVQIFRAAEDIAVMPSIFVVGMADNGILFLKINSCLKVSLPPHIMLRKKATAVFQRKT